jgi:hypothetical protein
MGDNPNRIEKKNKIRRLRPSNKLNEVKSIEKLQNMPSENNELLGMQSIPLHSNISSLLLEA